MTSHSKNPLTPRRGPVELVGWHPDIERATMLTRTTISVLGTTFVTVLLLALLSQAQTPLGWLLATIAALSGLTAPWLWRRLQQRGATRLEIWDLAPRWAEPVARAANQADRLRQLAQRSPEGPVADHFHRLAHTADGYVVALHQAAVHADAAVGADPDPDLEDDMTRIVGQLTELVEAAERLRKAQRHHLEVSPLVELTVETDQLRAIIEAEAQTDASFVAPTDSRAANDRSDPGSPSL